MAIMANCNSNSRHSTAFNSTLVTSASSGSFVLVPVVNTPQISGSPLFKNFFLSAQFASWNGTANPITLTVHLLGGETVSLSEVSALEREELVKEVGLGEGLRMMRGAYPIQSALSCFA